jgi:hypothetical protein
MLGAVPSCKLTPSVSSESRDLAATAPIDLTSPHFTASLGALRRVGPSPSTRGSVDWRVIDDTRLLPCPVTAAGRLMW